MLFRSVAVRVVDILSSDGNLPLDPSAHHGSFATDAEWALVTRPSVKDHVLTFWT